MSPHRLTRRWLYDADEHTYYLASDGSWWTVYGPDLAAVRPTGYCRAGAPAEPCAHPDTSWLEEQDLQPRLDAIEEGLRRSRAARALGSARTPRKAVSSRRNGVLGAAHGVKGGRPTRYLLVDDLGRCVGETRRPGPAGTRTEYGLRTPEGFRAEGIAELVRPSEWAKTHRNPDGSVFGVPERRWDA